MARIRTKSQARRLRPIATERARHSKYKVGDTAFYGDIGWYPVRIISRSDTKPNRIFTLASVRTGRGYFWMTGRALFDSFEHAEAHGGEIGRR